VYGWFYVILAAYLLLVGLVSAIGESDVTPAPTPFGAARGMGWPVALFQGILWLATGLAILRRKLIAVRLVWTVVILGALGVLFRGIIPADLVIWLLTLGLAKWFADTKRQFLTA